MSSSDKFTDTVFLKENGELKRKLTILEELKDKVNETDLIEKEIKLTELELIGENNISFELKHSNIGMYVLHDINIVYKDLSTKIDYIIITPASCYLVECKNLIGNVTINKEGEFKREYFLNGTRVKETISSPYTQANCHQEALKKIWLEKSNKFLSIFFDKSFDINYKLLVVFSNSKGLLNLKYAPKHIKESIVRVENLVEYLKKDIESTEVCDLYSKKQMENIATQFLKLHKDINKNYTEKYTT